MEVLSPEPLECRAAVHGSCVKRSPFLEGPDIDVFLLMDPLRLGGASDQLDMWTLMTFEKGNRGLQLAVEVCAEVGQASSREVARYWNGVTTLTDVVGLALRQCRPRRAKEETELGVARVW